MRLPLCLVMLALPLGAAGPAPPSTPKIAPKPLPKLSRDCPVPSVTLIDRAGKPVKPERLGELPPAMVMLAVDRRVGGCIEPAVISGGIGAGGRLRPGR